MKTTLLPVSTSLHSESNLGPISISGVARGISQHRMWPKHCEIHCTFFPLRLLCFWKMELAII